MVLSQPDPSTASVAQQEGENGHEDGQSQIMAANVPNCISYDPSFAYELMVIIQNELIPTTECY